MKLKDLSEAKDQDLRASLAAMRRAAEEAKEVAIATGTGLVVRKDGKVVRIPPEELRKLRLLRGLSRDEDE
ncbi:MAG: hypothetical protein LBP68_01260 [Acidobacteriota bacterium]|jgi:hypothetical protein|nr:hypothetical protein [Acidobacteriota bacterium]